MEEEYVERREEITKAYLEEHRRKKEEAEANGDRALVEKLRLQ